MACTFTKTGETIADATPMLALPQPPGPLELVPEPEPVLPEIDAVSVLPAEDTSATETETMAAVTSGSHGAIAHESIPFHGIIVQAAGRYEVDPHLIRAIILAESGYNPYGYLGIIIFVLAYSLVPLENYDPPAQKQTGAVGRRYYLGAGGHCLFAVGDTHTRPRGPQAQPARICRTVPLSAGGHDLHQRHGRAQRLPDPAGLSGVAGVFPAKIFWVTGLLAFLISPIADNLTTALLMGAVVMAVGGDNKKFVALACINVVVGANAGGAFSPFRRHHHPDGLAKGKVQFTQFFNIFFPSVVNWLIPAVHEFCHRQGRLPKNS
jgi:hypothetical protein